VSNSSAIRVENLSKVYSGPEPVHAVRPCTFELQSGGSYAVIGPSGSGKSTLLHILGLLDEPSGGRVLLGSTDPRQLSDAQRTSIRANHIGFVFQQFHLISHLTATENIQLRLAAAGIPRSQRANIADEALDRVGLTHRRSFLPSQLSGGEQQRVAIARGIAGAPVVLLCDEPSGNLDAANTRIVIDLLRELHAEGQTVLVVTHDAGVGGWVDHLFEMHDGFLRT
jgi:putative ABC transport system ATP-binding protein